MKNLAWLIILLGSAACWAQSGGVTVNPDSSRPTESFGTSTNLNSLGKFDSSLDQARDHLALKQEQQPLWRAYASKVDAYTDRFYREEPVTSSQADTAPRKIGRLVDNLQNRLAALEDVELAAKNLFEGLTPEQQKTANQMLLSTIPTFSPSTIGSSPVKEVSRRKEGKSDAGSRARRSGSFGGGGF